LCGRTDAKKCGPGLIREIVAGSLGDQRAEIGRRREAKEAAEVERDCEIVATVGARRRAEGKP
jgi:hypothetical protein